MIIFWFLLILLGLGIYSYSQIDLNLTLFRFPQFLNFQNFMIQLGYYHRPLSAGIFLTIILLLFIYYIFLLKSANQTNIRKLGFLIGGICLIALISYPAFSYDFFNYLFDARILTHYGQNPYLFKALDFPADSWIRFMHWTHRTYPYGPVWILISVPFSLLGLGKFLLTMVNFKIMFILFYLANIVLISKISHRLNKDISQWQTLFFALNPLVVIESVISPHIDSAMATLMLLSVLYFINNSRIASVILMLLSGGIKFLTWLLTPLLLIPKMSINRFLLLSTILLFGGLIPVIWQREFYPWYLLPAIALLSMQLRPDKNLAIITVALSLGLLLRYLPFIYQGDYNFPVPQAENLLLILPLIISMIPVAVKRIVKK